MISIKVDEAFAFDMLAILQIKSSKSEEDTINFIEFSQQLVDELGLDVCNIIFTSPEYLEMIDVNQRVFNLIDMIASGADERKFSAKYVHDANMKRFIAKKSLQEEFFSNNLTERKTIA